MRRGEIRLVVLDSARGSEAPTARPAVIISNDGANAAATRRGKGVVTVVPLTSNLTTVHPFQVLLRAGECGLATDSKAQAEQVRSVSAERVGRPMGRLPAEVLGRLEAALRLHLGL